MTNASAFRYSAVFSKTDDMVFISHLDLMTLFRRAMRRAGLPFVLTGGFTPRVKISIPKALKLGAASDKEEMDLWLREDMDAVAVMDALNKELPEGVRILEVKRKEI